MSSDLNPRDSFLQRHRHVTPKLDAARRAAVHSIPLTWGETVRAIFGPNLLFWRVVLTVWVTLLVIHFTLGRHAPTPEPTQIPAAEIAAWVNRLKAHDTLAETDRLN